MRAKTYQSKEWLKYQLFNKQKTVQQIADECGVTYMTIMNAMKKNGLKK